MGESACLMQQPFSYAAGPPSDAQQGNPLHALGQSISFGRFVSEKLDWEKWSTFSSHNRYVEEAERYSRPGSVAQKKAFFEAHYKKLAAARKAAAEAMLEQEHKEASENSAEQKSENLGTQDSQKVSGNPQDEVKPPNVDGLESKSNFEKDLTERMEVEGDGLAAERKVLVENPMRADSTNKLGITDNRDSVVTSLNGLTQKENYTRLESSKKTDDTNRTRADSNAEEPLPMTSKASQVGLMPRSSRRTVSSSPSLSGKPWKLSEPKAKPSSLVHSKKEKCVTPVSKKSKMNSAEKMRLTPKSSHVSYGFTPVKEFNRLTSIIRKIDNSRATSSDSKPSKDCLTPMRTPNKGSVSRVTKNPLNTPVSENRRGIMGINSSAKASKTGRARWNFLATENKLYSPNCFTPFGLRTEERAERRKKKLEEKFKATEAQKQQQQAALKEQAEKGASKFHQRLCFKARPLPSFYKERGTKKEQMIKALLPHQESPALEGKPSDKKVTIGQNKTYKVSQRSQSAKQEIKASQREQ